jgi:hypothetical protein
MIEGTADDEAANAGRGEGSSMRVVARVRAGACAIVMQDGCAEPSTSGVRRALGAGAQRSPCFLGRALAAAVLARRVHGSWQGVTMTATHAQIVELLGDVDELYVKRLEDTGASLDEIGEALDDLEKEGRLGERVRPTSIRVAEIRAILEELYDTDDVVDAGYRVL